MLLSEAKVKYRDININWGSGGVSTSEETLTVLINQFLEQYKGLVMGILGLSTLSMVLIGLYLFFNLGAGTTNFANKQINMKRIAIWAVCLMLLGSLDLIVALIYNAFR